MPVKMSRKHSGVVIYFIHKKIVRLQQWKEMQSSKLHIWRSRRKEERTNRRHENDATKIIDYNNITRRTIFEARSVSKAMKCGYRLCPRSDAIPPTPTPHVVRQIRRPRNAKSTLDFEPWERSPLKMMEIFVSKFEHHFKLITHIITWIFETFCRRGWNKFLLQEVVI